MNAQDFDFIRQLFRQRTGIHLGDDKAYLVEARLEPMVRRHRLGSLADLAARLRDQTCEDLVQQVVEAMLTNETSFFRDGHPFEAIKNHILPELMMRRGHECTLRIWSAACSSGQEPYSIAMLLRTCFPMLNRWDVRILASDVSTEILDRAREGRYTQSEVLRGLPADYLAAYFRKEGVTWKIREDIQRMIEFRRINLVGDWPALPDMDIIFLRNVMIYFDVETKKAVLRKIAKVLRTDGYLVLGGAETTFSLHDSFRRMGLSERSSFYHLVG